MALTPGKRLRFAREYHAPKVTQLDLATFLGLDRTKIARYETVNEDQVPAEVLSRSAMFLGIREEYFFDQNVEGPPIGYRITDELGEVRRLPKGTASRAAEGVRQGDKVLLRSFAGVIAGEEEEEAAYVEEETRKAVFAFITGNDADHHDVLTVKGNSMHPRIASGNEVVVRHEASPKPGWIIVARNREGQCFLKVLRVGKDGREFLESINPDYAPIMNVFGWKFIAVAIANISPTESGSSNIEWDEGRPLRG